MRQWEVQPPQALLRNARAVESARPSADTRVVRIPANTVPAVVIAAPCLSWLIALTFLHGNGSGSTYALLFIGLPFALTLTAALVAGRRVAALPFALLSGAIGLVSWLFVAIVFASKFAD